LKSELDSEDNKDKKIYLNEQIDVLKTKKELLEVKINEKQQEIDKLDNSSISTNKLLEI
jgi:hypothetical protein